MVISQIQGPLVYAIKLEFASEQVVEFGLTEDS
jgi:hypothetical protein